MIQHAFIGGLGPTELLVVLFVWAIPVALIIVLFRLAHRAVRALEKLAESKSGKSGTPGS